MVLPELHPTCPGATPFPGPVGDLVIVCGPLKRDRDLDTTVADKGAPESVTFSTHGDPRHVVGFCCGSFGDCLIWQGETARIAAGRERLETEEDVRQDDTPVLDDMRERGKWREDKDSR